MSDIITESANALAGLLAAGGTAFVEEAAKGAASSAHTAGRQIYQKIRGRLGSSKPDATSLAAALRAALDEGVLQTAELEAFVARMSNNQAGQIQNNIGQINAEKYVGGNQIQANTINL